ncbi:MAG: hypothetical protein K5872_14755 [Rhizobiaceae bacterium]|nr:hypothetical protein [Rhizobiaceae bacterium]MCV0407481.1 hypothetical protein [Rhizobiaceae bacterium]
MTNRKQEPAKPAPDDVPGIEQNDWDAVRTGEVVPEQRFENGDMRFRERSGEQSLEEEEDNSYQESDDALPDDSEEETIERNPSREGGHFDRA